jgi:hypothetical protein
MLQSCLGLSFSPKVQHITFDEPVLPMFLDEVVLRGLQSGNGSADLALRRSGDSVMIDVLERQGKVRVLSVG